MLIESPEVPVEVSDEELTEIDAGLAEARAGGRVDARAFLRELRRCE
ncbi:MAG: hypothetical protein KC431_08765 [Myxococcales bacterium]|nr:hypothetical protein [Myxococcales bacterium]